ncbi:unnamed protein product [Adineta steineri]|uniref:Uncharacterized protein n=1 Tax=Adineta steineri TaxID=433720 RepID=A0A814UAX0_9BILA|nr:unnamed protein product [Adineta steineri]CAF1404311.1 unnamed protein product [Adineta steineri]
MFIYCSLSYFIRQCIHNHIILGNEAQQPTILISYGVIVHINRYVLQYWSSKPDIRVAPFSPFDIFNFRRLIVKSHRIFLEGVIALTLSDDNNTFVQSQLFLSCYPIQQSTQLQSLTLIEIDIKSLKSISSMLEKLRHLRSFSFNIETMRQRFSA